MIQHKPPSGHWDRRLGRFPHANLRCKWCVLFFFLPSLLYLAKPQLPNKRQPWEGCRSYVWPDIITIYYGRCQRILRLCSVDSERHTHKCINKHFAFTRLCEPTIYMQINCDEMTEFEMLECWSLTERNDEKQKKEENNPQTSWEKETQMDLSCYVKKCRIWSECVKHIFRIYRK